MNEDEDDVMYSEGFESGFREGKEVGFEDGFISATNSFHEYIDQLEEDGFLASQIVAKIKAYNK